MRTRLPNVSRLEKKQSIVGNKCLHCDGVSVSTHKTSLRGKFPTNCQCISSSFLEQAPTMKQESVPKLTICPVCAKKRIMPHGVCWHLACVCLHLSGYHGGFYELEILHR